MNLQDCYCALSMNHLFFINNAAIKKKTQLYGMIDEDYYIYMIEEFRSRSSSSSCAVVR